MEKEVGEQERAQPAVGKAGRGGTVNTVGGGGGNPGRMLEGVLKDEWEFANLFESKAYLRRVWR